MGNLSITNLPVGFIFPIINSNVVPVGSLECNGALISQTTYANLHTGHQLSLNGLYGISGGSFYLPDFRGRTPRGWDNGAGRDPDVGSRFADSGGATGNNVGSMQNDAIDLNSHAHEMGSTGYRQVGEIIGGGTARTMVEINTPVQPNAPNTGVMVGGAGLGLETRMKNFYVMWCIKY